jgi:hypothetical protein
MAGTVAPQVASKSVWQVMASYGIGAWIVLQVADTLSSLVGPPLWFGQALLVLLGIGVVVLFATSLVQPRAAPGMTSGIVGEDHVSSDGGYDSRGDAWCCHTC